MVVWAAHSTTKRTAVLAAATTLGADRGNGSDSSQISRCRMASVWEAATSRAPGTMMTAGAAHPRPGEKGRAGHGAARQDQGPARGCQGGKAPPAVGDVVPQAADPDQGSCGAGHRWHLLVALRLVTAGEDPKRHRRWAVHRRVGQRRGIRGGCPAEHPADRHEEGRHEQHEVFRHGRTSPEANLRQHHGKGQGPGGGGQQYTQRVADEQTHG